MKKIVMLFLSTLFTQIFMYSQSTKTVLGTFISCNTVYNYEFNKLPNSLYSFRIKPVDSIEINNDDSVSSNKEYVFSEFSQNDFVKQCSVALNIYKCTASDLITNIDVARDIFYNIKTQLEINDDEPITAFVKLKNSIIPYYYYSKSKSGKLNSHGVDSLQQRKISLCRIIRKLFSHDSIFHNRDGFMIESVEIEFEDGTIKNIIANLLPYNSEKKVASVNPIQFKNEAPISVSSLNDPSLFDYIRLYAVGIAPWSDNYSSLGIIRGNSSLPNNNQFQKSEKIRAFIVLSDLIEYINVLESNKEDYSPVNCVVSLSKNNPIQVLKKERRGKLLMVKVFSDLYGMQGDEPNGILQMEVSRKINLNTQREKNRYGNSGFLSYIEPKFTFSRIEENQNLMQLDISNFDTLSLGFKLNPVDIIKYQNSLFDLETNIYRWSLPNYKTSIHINLLGGITRTTIMDSVAVIEGLPSISNIANINDLSTLKYGISAFLDIKPDSRYGMTIRGDILAVRPLSVNYFIKEGVFSNNDNIGEEFDILSVSFDAFLELSKGNALFFRYRISGRLGLDLFRDEPFTQIQLGYQADLFRVAK